MEITTFSSRVTHIQNGNTHGPEAQLDTPLKLHLSLAQRRSKRTKRAAL